MDFTSAGIILGKGSANERRRYNMTSSLIGWAHNQIVPCVWDRWYGKTDKLFGKIH